MFCFFCSLSRKSSHSQIKVFSPRQGKSWGENDPNKKCNLIKEKCVTIHHWYTGMFFLLMMQHNTSRHGTKSWNCYWLRNYIQNWHLLKLLRDAFKKKKIAYNETLSYLGVGGLKKIPTILHFRNGTFFYGRGGQNYIFYVSFLEKSSLRRENFQIYSPSIANFHCFTLWFN